MLKYKNKYFLNIADVFLILLVFTMPISSSFKSICMGLFLVSFFFIPNYLSQLLDLLKTNWFKAILLFMALVLISSILSPASFSEKWQVITKYSKLLYLPVLVVGFQKYKTRIYALYAFLLAMLFTCSLSLLKHFNFLHIALFDKINEDFVFRNHIMTGIMMSFATYLSAWFFMQVPKSVKIFTKDNLLRLCYITLIFLFSFQIFFISNGKTAYFIYFILTLLFFIHFFKIYQIILGLLCLSLMFFMGYKYSPTMNAGINQIITQYESFKENKDTSVGFRLQFHEYANNLFKRNILLGNGTASFTYFFRTEQPIKSWDGVLLEPHSLYWLIAAEFGIVGILCLLILFSTFFYAILNLDKMKSIAIPLFVIFCIGNLSDSLLFYSGSGYFFILFLALCLGEGVLKTR